MPAPGPSLMPMAQTRLFSRGTVTQLGSTPFSCGIHSAVIASNGDDQNKLTLTLPLVGEATIKVGRQSFRSRFGESAVLLNGESGQAQTTTYAGVLVNLRPERLARESNPVQGHLWGPGATPFPFSRSH